MIRIRGFQNTDLSSLASIWQRHYLLAGIESSCPSTVWEFCVLSKPFFDPDSFFLAFQDETPVGFLHASFSGDAKGDDEDRQIGLINAFCVVGDPGESRIASELLQRAFQYFGQRNVPVVLGTSAPSHFAFYLGIPPSDGLLGVPSRDTRLQFWLQEGGMVAWQPTSRWELELATFRPPMDRTQIQIRRQFQVSRVIDGQMIPWWIAATFGHSEQQYFQLAGRAPFQSQMGVTFWQPDSTIRGQESTGYLMVLESASDDSASKDRLVFLLSESLRQLQQDRVERVRVILSSDEIHSTSVLQRLGFRCQENGIVYRKSSLQFCGS